MKTTKQILKESEKKGVLAFMRANPITRGHSKVIDAALAEPGTKRIYVSHSQDNKKNPLSADEKLHYIHKMYPNHKHFFRKSTPEEPTIFHAAARMHREGIKHLTVIAGEDRVKEFHDKLHAYNGKFDKNGNGYHFKSIQVKSAGSRDPDAEGVEGMSATKMRQAALKGDKKTFRSGLHHNLTDKDADEMMHIIKSRLGVVSEEDELRNDFILGEKFNVGEFVTNGSITGEIIFKGANYVTIVSEGKEHKLWLDNISTVEASKKRDQLYKESFIYKGYKTKNLTRELAEGFKKISQETDDQYAFLNCLKSTDFIMGVTESDIVNNYGNVKTQLDRAIRYSSKFSINITDKLQEVEEGCFNLAILEDFKFATTDRMMIARMLAKVAGIQPAGNDPITIINRSVYELRKSELTAPGWQLLGRMMKVASSAGIKWNRDIFSNSQQTMMGI